MCWKKIAVLLLILSFGVEAKILESENRICVNDLCSQVEVFKSERLTGSPVLVITIHGDSAFSRPSYHYRVAKRVALESENVVSVGILRPGYTDDFGRESDGERGDAVGDNYDDVRVYQVADVVESLKESYNPKAVVIAGHSGGSAIAAKMVSLKPTIADSVLIVSCPCDINSWREDMLKKSKYEGFKGKLKITSPIDLVSKIDVKTNIYIFVGENDRVTLPYLSKQYYQALINEGKKAKSFTVPGGHEIFKSESVFKNLLEVVESHNKSLQLTH